MGTGVPSSMPPMGQDNGGLLRRYGSYEPGGRKAMEGMYACIVRMSVCKIMLKL